MKITFLSPPPNLSGGLRVVATHADRLLARGHDVVVVAGKPRVAGLNDFLKALARGKLPRQPPKESHYDRMQAPLRIIDHAGPIEAADVPDADAVIATWWETAFMAAALPPEKGRKFYFVQHHEVHDRLRSHISAGSYHLPLKKVTISHWLRDIMAVRYGDPEVAMVPNSVDTDLFHAPVRGRQNRPTVGLMYSPTPFKGVDVALRALADLRRTHPDLHVIAFGTGALQPDLPLPTGSHYVRAPAQDDLRGLYKAVDVWLCASRSEGFHLPPLEAMACRTPVVATRVGGPNECVQHGVNGFLCEVEDAAGLADRLRAVLDLPEADWRRMSDAALARATSYTWDDAAALFEKALRMN